MAKKKKIVLFVIFLLFSLLAVGWGAYHSRVFLCKVTKGHHCYAMSPQDRSDLCVKSNRKSCHGVKPIGVTRFEKEMTLEEQRKRSQEIYERAQRLKKLGLEEYSEEKK